MKVVRNAVRGGTFPIWFRSGRFIVQEITWIRDVP